MNKNHPKTIIGVMGGGDTNDESYRIAYELGQKIAKSGWLLLNGGRNCGVMEASARGAKENGGLTIGILPDSHTGQTSQWIDIPILTGIGIARNAINILSSHVIVACPGGAGTLSEIAMALKSNRKVIALGWPSKNSLDIFFKCGQLYFVSTVEETIEQIKLILETNS